MVNKLSPKEKVYTMLQKFDFNPIEIWSDSQVEWPSRPLEDFRSYNVNQYLDFDHNMFVDIYIETGFMECTNLRSKKHTCRLFV